MTDDMSLARPDSPLHYKDAWDSIFEGTKKVSLERVLPDYLRSRRWFGGKARTIQRATILDDFQVSYEDQTARVLLVQVEYKEGVPETYVLPLTFAPGDKAEVIRRQFPGAILVGLRAQGDGEQGILYDALWDEGFSKTLLEVIAQRQRIGGKTGELIASSTRVLNPLLRSASEQMKPSVLGAEQSNTSVRYGDKLLLKVIRKLEPGINPELEIGRFLTEKAGFPNIPPVAGAIEYRQPNREPMTVTVLHGFVPNQGDAWQYTLDFLGRYFERAVSRAMDIPEIPVASEHVLDTQGKDPPAVVKEVLGLYLERAAILGQRTAELHLALASNRDDPSFAPEPWSDSYQRSQHQAMRRSTTQVFRLLSDRLKDLPQELQPAAQRVLALEDDILRRFRSFQDRRLTSMRVRTHGDYHLGQVLYTGKDFVIIDFEGEPARPLGERREKTSVLRDVAGMLRSFHYASFSSAFTLANSPHPLSLSNLDPWRKLFHHWASASFLQSYLSVCQRAVFIPEDRKELRLLLDIYLLDKGIYEIGYELNNRPPWVAIPLRGILEIMELAPVQTS